MTNAVATRTASEPAVFARLRAQVPAVARILDDEDTARRFIQLMLSEVPKTPELLECSEESIVGALMRCAQFQLEPGPQQHVYLIPRLNKKSGRKEANWEIGYRGMIELASRVGIQIVADVVKANDQWRYWRLPDRDHFEHAPNSGPRGDTIRAYAVARFPDGRPPQVHVSELDEIHAARELSDSYRDRYGKVRPSSPWVRHFDAQAMKTPVRRLFKWIGSTQTLRQAAAADGTAYRVPVENAGALQIGPGQGTPDHPITAHAGPTDPDPDPAPIVDEPELHDLTGGQHAQLTEWGVDDDVRHALVWHATEGRTASSKALTKREQDAFWTLCRAFGADVLTIAGDVSKPGSTTLEVEGVEVTVEAVLEAAHGDEPEQPEQPPLPAEPA